jgi:hypothetical protein
MQTAIRKSRVGLWHSLKVEYLVLACGLMVAASAAFTAGALQGEEPTLDLMRSGTSLSLAAEPPGLMTHDLTIYVLDSQEAADKRASLLHEDVWAMSQAHTETGALPSSQFMVVNSAEEQALLTVMVGELMAIEQETGVSTPSVVDLR